MYLDDWLIRVSSPSQVNLCVEWFFDALPSPSHSHQKLKNMLVSIQWSRIRTTFTNLKHTQTAVISYHPPLADLIHHLLSIHSHLNNIIYSCQECVSYLCKCLAYNTGLPISMNMLWDCVWQMQSKQLVLPFVWIPKQYISPDSDKPKHIHIMSYSRQISWIYQPDSQLCIHKSQPCCQNHNNYRQPSCCEW